MILDDEPKYTASELVNPRTIRLMDWFLKSQVSQGLIARALSPDYDIEDLIQTACLVLSRYPGKRKFAVSTIVCKKALQVAISRASRNRIRPRMATLWTCFSDGDETEIHELAIEPTQLDECARQDEAQQVAAVLKTLPLRERFVLIGRFGFEGQVAELEQIGDCLMVSRERVRQIETAALHRFKNHMELRTAEQERRVAGLRKVIARRREMTAC